MLRDEITGFDGIIWIIPDFFYKHHLCTNNFAHNNYLLVKKPTSPAAGVFFD
jgi:hypothetical protein